MRMEPNLWRAGGVREAGEEWVGSGRNREKFDATLCSISQSNKRKQTGANKDSVRT